jgi:parallel beta-helix repeat protein
MRNRIQQERLGFMLLLGLAAIILAASPAQAALTPVTTCGQTLSTAGDYILSVNLDCTGTFATGINIAASNVNLHLAGHSLGSTDCDGTKSIAGIDVPGGLSNVQIDGGIVSGFNDGISLYSANSRVTGIAVGNSCFFAIALSGTNNRVDTSIVTGSHMDGIGVGAATGATIVSNFIFDNARVGVDISNFSNNNVVENNIFTGNGLTDGEQGAVAIFNGTGNLIAGNTMIQNFNGVEIESSGNLVRNNTVNGSSNTGIFITASGSPSTVRSNIVLGSGIVDMSDDGTTCNGDIWRKNTFQTDLAGGVPNGGPGVGCIK